MKTFMNVESQSEMNSVNDRRDFIKKAMFFGMLTGLGSISILGSCKEESGDEISPAEDLMREHGLLNRVMLIYDSCKLRLAKNEEFDFSVINDSAGIIRIFIEQYHEKLEEDFLFPRFAKANQLTDLVQVLFIQHHTGRNITEEIIRSTKVRPAADSDSVNKIIKLLSDFVNMYRPHEAREDTVLFPAIRKVTSKKEYASLGDEFEDREHKLFGNDGFESMVDKVAGIEKRIGIYNLAGFTP